jgi:hypothetical protein
MSIEVPARLFAATFLVASLSVTTSPAEADDWEWTLIPYAWASDIGVDLFVNDDPVVGADIGFDDILDNLDFAAQIHFEGRRDKGGFFLDLTYLDLGSSQTTGARPPLPGGTEIRSDLRTMLFEAAGFYRPSGSTHGLDILLGVRVLDMDLTADFTLPLPPPLNVTRQINPSDTFTDGFVGLRYTMPFAERWMLVGRGDVGAGDSELAWNSSLSLGYLVGKKRQNFVMVGYRHLDLEFKSTASGGQAVEIDMTMSGPGVGFGFRF